MKPRSLLVAAFVVSSAIAQESNSAPRVRHSTEADLPGESSVRPELRRTDPGLPAEELRQLRRMASHFADEEDDDSVVEFVDTLSFADLKQVLLVTSAGIPRCLTVTVFTKAATGYVKTWSTAATPAGEPFCDNLGIPAEVKAGSRHSIDVQFPKERHSPTSSHADVIHVRYYWTGETYVLSRDQGIGLEYIPK